MFDFLKSLFCFLRKSELPKYYLSPSTDGKWAVNQLRDYGIFGKDYFTVTWVKTPEEADKVISDLERKPLYSSEWS